MIKIAILTTDNREHFRDYSATVPYFGMAPEALLEGFSRTPEIEVHVLSCIQRPMRSPDKIADNIWYHGLHVPKIGWLRTFYQGCIRTIRAKLRTIQPDIVHGQGTERECAISAVFSGFPNVITLHGNMRLIARINRAKPPSYLWLSAQLERFIIPRSGGVVCISRYTQNAVRDLARETWIVPNAIDREFFTVKRAARPDPIILCVGNITLRKNQNAFIRALDPLAKQMQFTIVFLGDAPPHDPYAIEFNQLVRARSWCRYEGFADRETLREWLARARFLVMPSLEENCPMVILEAMAATLPVVAAEVGGVPDLVEEGATGTFCDPADAESIRRAITRTLEDPDRAQAMAETAKRKALTHYEPAVVAGCHVKIYQDVLSSSGRI